MRILLFILLSISLANGQSFHITKSLHHLRNSSIREWSSFPEEASASLNIEFELSTTSWQTLRLRQQDVRQLWRIEINGKEIGNLIADEKDLTLHFPISPGILSTGKNALRITTTSTASDDIVVGDIDLFPNDVKTTLSQANLNITVSDKQTGSPLPARITILDERRSMHMIDASDSNLAVRPGCVYTANGIAAISLPAGRYKVFASRGFE